MQSNVAKKAKSAEVTKESKITPLFQILNKVDDKRSHELIRFRTCCADPRASK